jgi:hypothetical protein
VARVTFKTSSPNMDSASAALGRQAARQFAAWSALDKWAVVSVTRTKQ